MRRSVAKIAFLAIALVLAFSSAFAQNTDIAGKWKTLDDSEKDAKGNPMPKSVVEIWRAEKDEVIDGIKYKKGAYYGKITKLFDQSKQNNLCTECAKSDARYNKKIVGLTIVTGLLKIEKNMWKADKSILDPNNGKIYDCSMWVEGGKLKVRGYIGMFYRTQTWEKF